MKRRMQLMMLAGFWLVLSTFGALSEEAWADSESTWQAGLSKVVITPDEPIWMDGYGNRKKPAEGKIHDLYARAAAFEDPQGKKSVFIATDLIGVPIKMVKAVSQVVQERHGLKRSELMFTCSHTHCGPALDHDLSHMLAMDEEDWAEVLKYQKQLNGKLIDLIDRALKDLQPARLSWGTGECTFATNRRPPIGEGPYDHDVPVLQVTSPDGSEVRGIVFGYACHNTTLSFYKWCGDYAGFAALYLENRHPEATALFFTGCGADQNPLPRRKLELAEKYGRSLGVSVEKCLEEEMQPIEGPLQTAFSEVDLEFQRGLDEEELKKQLESENRYKRNRAEFLLQKIEKQGSLSETYAYPIQVWRMGDSLTWVALGGEVVVDYSLRLKKELGSPGTWVVGYANDVMGYIPSERVLKEGGYEGASSMIVYQKPSPWKPGLEDRIVDTVKKMTRSLEE